MKRYIKTKYAIYNVYILDNKVYGSFGAEIAESYESALLNCLEPKTLPGAILRQPLKIKRIKKINDFVYFTLDSENDEIYSEYNKNFAVEKL